MILEKQKDKVNLFYFTFSKNLNWIKINMVNAMSFIKDMAKDKIIIKKQNGKIYECDNADIQKNKAFIYCGEIPLDEFDIIIHKIREGYEKEYVVTNAGYYNKMLRPHYQADIEPKTVFDNKNETSVNDITISGNNSKVNINSIDNSINLFQIPFDEIYEKLNEIEDETVRNESVKCLKELEESNDSETYKNKYVKFISALSDHVAIIAPFLPLLTQALL